MKRFFIAATALLLTVSSLQAQTDKSSYKNTHHKGIHGRKEMANLNLSDEQKQKIKSLNEDYRKQFATLKSNTSMTVGDYRTKTAALRKEQHEKLQAIFTPEQKTQMAAQRNNMQQKMKDAQVKRVDKMKTKLGLTDEQVNKLKENQAGLREKVKTIRQDKTLSDTQKKEQVRTLFKQQREQMKTLLTPEQLEKLKSGGKSKGISSK